MGVLDFTGKSTPSPRLEPVPVLAREETDVSGALSWATSEATKRRMEERAHERISRSVSSTQAEKGAREVMREELSFVSKRLDNTNRKLDALVEMVSVLTAKLDQHVQTHKTAPSVAKTTAPDKIDDPAAVLHSPMLKRAQSM